MSDRNWRSGWRDDERARDTRDGEYREVSRRHDGEDEPWREERRTRYPDEAYGGEREAGGYRGYRTGRSGEGHGSADERSYRPAHVSRRPDSYARDDHRRGNSPSWGTDSERGFDRDRSGSWNRDERDQPGEWARHQATGGFGSEYEGWRSGAGFGFGPEERPGGAERFEDTDWMPNRPGRGRSTWAGDWGLDRSGRGAATQSRDSYTAGRHGSGGARGEDYRGRGPREYRRGDDRIREDICDRLTDDYAIDASDVALRVEGGEVTLTGFVASRDQKRRAEDVAAQVSGVREVINQLRVNRGESPAPSSTQPTPPGGRAQRGAANQSGVAADRDKPRGDR